MLAGVVMAVLVVVVVLFVFVGPRLNDGNTGSTGPVASIQVPVKTP